ncbi:MAG: LysR family transcriptional regulator [Chloroflexi bacterium]|nr:LysR family transcriptional regulator [Chloroflexota bacterium]
MERGEQVLAIGTGHAGRDALAWRIAKLRRYDLNLLLSLHALLHTRNVTQAGEWLGVTQPAMSSDLRRLRQMFKDELLVRSGREYQLTTLASSLVEPLTNAVADIERTLTWRPTFDPSIDTRSFSIAMSDHVMALLLPRLAARLPLQAPNVTIHTRGLSGLSADPVAATVQGEVDLSIGAFQSFAESCTEVLYTDRWLCAVSADHPDVGDHMTLELFCRLPHLEWRLRTPIVQSHAEVLYGSKGIQRRVTLTTESFALLPELLRGSRLVALVHERLARRVVGLKLLEPPVPIPDVQESMYWSTQVDRDPGHAWLRDLMRGIGRDL